jgi:glycosyltransferase involved in cell wall biosynthesis
MEKPVVLYFILRVDRETQITGGAWSTLHIITHLEKFAPFVVSNQSDLLTCKLDEFGIPCKVIACEYPRLNFTQKKITAKIKALWEILVYNLKFGWIAWRINPTIINCDEMGAIMVFLGAKLTGSKLVIYARNGFRSRQLRWVYKMPMFFSDAIVAISRELGDFIKEHGGQIISRKVVPIYNAVDINGIDKFKRERSMQACRAELGMPMNTTAIGVVAFIEDRKRQKEFLLHVVRRMKNNKTLAFYLIGGIKEDDYYNQCRRIIEEQTIENVELVGFHENIYPWYRALDVVCLPSKSEGLPRALIEASAFGLSVVAFNIPGCREAVVNGETGFLVETFDEFTQHLSTLIQNEAIRQQMGKKGYEYVSENFDALRNTRMLETLYEGLL